MVMPSYAYLCFIALLLSFANASDSNESDGDDSSEESSEEVRNGTAQDLYVIKSVVYEIGILTDAGNDTDSSNETHERVDISIFEPKLNGSLVDLNIPVPIQTNVSGVAVTGLISSHLGSLILPPNSTTGDVSGAHFPIFPDKQIQVSRNISTVNKDEGASILAGLPKILGLDKLGIRNESEKNATES